MEGLERELTYFNWMSQEMFGTDNDCHDDHCAGRVVVIEPINKIIIDSRLERFQSSS